MDNINPIRGVGLGVCCAVANVKQLTEIVMISDKATIFLTNYSIWASAGVEARAHYCSVVSNSCKYNTEEDRWKAILSMRPTRSIYDDLLVFDRAVCAPC